MNDRIQRLLERARRSYCASSTHPEPPWHPNRKPTQIEYAHWTVKNWLEQTVILGEDDLIAGGNPHIRHGEVRPKAVSFDRQPFTPQFPMDESLAEFFHEGMLSPAGNHTTLDYETIFRIGFRGLITRIDEQLQRPLQDTDATAEKREFWNALKILAEGYIAFCRRHAELAESQAGLCSNATRVKELTAIAEHCRRVVGEPPRNFREACQCAWFAFMYLPDAPGRLDQYLYPYYKRDMASGDISREFAKELISALWIKYFEYAGSENAVSAFHHITLGGSTPDGHDASNELTDLCMEVTADLRLHRPQIGLRWNREMPRKRLANAIRVLKAGTGNPDICNDEVIIPALTRIGIKPEDARDFSLSGCHEVVITGKAQMGSVEGFINFPKTLRMALGLEPMLFKGKSLKSMRTFDDLLANFDSAMQRIAEMAHAYAMARDRRGAQELGGNLNVSLVVADCISKGLGYYQGGARYNFCNFNLIGIANVADSLMAIRHLIFEDNEMKLPEFVRIIADDWIGNENLRMKIIRHFPKYGNDDQETDSLASEQVMRFDKIMKRYTPFRGGKYILGTTCGGENMHIEFGRMTGATPDGRRACEPIADSMGAAQGRDRQGITALLNSVAKLPHSQLPTAATLNVKLDPRLLSASESIDKVATLIEAHFLTGGQQFQFNLVDRQMLTDARANPDNYPDLMVRVAGYCAQFTSLWPDLQDEIISRTEHVA